MMIEALKVGFIKGVKILISLLKIVVPIYIVVVIIKYSPIMDAIERVLSPMMGFFGLPAEAVMPLVSGFFTDEYGAIAAISAIDPMTTAQITTLTMMVAACHSLLVESAIAKKIGLNISFFLVFRFILCICVGLLVSWIGGIFL